MMQDFNPAPYMRWAKFRAEARYDLAGSNLLPCVPEDVPGILDGVPLTGPGPDGYPPLFEAIAARYRVRPEEIALGNGCSGANFLACAALLSHGDEALVEHPVYDPLPAAARLAGARTVFFERLFEEGWTVNPDRVARGMTERTRLVVVSSPHNPSGAIVPPDIIRALGNLVEKHDAWLLVDEVYRDATYDRPRETSARAHSRCIATNSLTKSYGLPGVRCGWAIGAPEVIERIRRVRDAVDAVGVYPAEAASARAFDVIDRLEARARSIIQPNLERLTRFMTSQNELSWVIPDGGTVAFPRLEGGRDTDAFVETLLRDHHTAVVPGRFFGAPRHFRVAFGGRPDTLDRGLEAIARALDQA